MLKKVFDCIKKNDARTVDQIATELKISPADVLVSVNELCARGFLKITPIPLNAGNDHSAQYSTSAKEFTDDSEYCVCLKLHSVTSDIASSEFGYWDTCCVCGKHLEDGFHYYNHYDGEDHDDIDV